MDLDDLVNAKPGEELTVCQWFLLCDHLATHTRPHPVLGDVPICDRCEAKLEAMG